MFNIPQERYAKWLIAKCANCHANVSVLALHPRLAPTLSCNDRQMEQTMQETLFLTISFLLIAIAAKKIGQWFSAVGLPYITGYLLAGVIAGPFVLNLLPSNAATDLRFIDEISLGIIAFVAGSELYLKEIRSRVRSISWIVGLVVLVALPLGGVALFVLTNYISFTAEMPLVDRVAVAILGSTILLALSPPSAIAVIKEVKAKGDFTRTLLGVTVSMDVVIVILFAVAVAIASALLTGIGFNITFVFLLVADLGLAIIAGIVAGYILQGLLASPFHKLVKMAGVLALGYAVFAGSHLLTELTKGSLIELHAEPLLVALIAGFYITNYTDFRNLFEELLHDVGGPVYVAFFTLTGVGLKLDILTATLPIALALFGIRFLGINVGAYFGSRMAGEPGNFTKYAGLALITQAGIALGLAREVAVEFPALGDAFATMVISVVVLNEIFGPMFLKEALIRVGEANLPEKRDSDSTRDVLILGVEPQSLELARVLQRTGWQVVLADTDYDHVARFHDSDLAVYHVPTISESALAGLLSTNTDAIVTLLEDDDANRAVLELAYKKGVTRQVVRPNDLGRQKELAEFGALIVDPTSAMVSLLKQTVQAPQSAAVLLRQDSGRELVQVTINNPDVSGQLLRDLRLPSDVLFLDVTRDGNVILPNGYTRLKQGDEVTLIGREPNLGDAMMKLGF
jgi:Trk K+ transport system NAD-binding subunit/Kef-type K+ transport system membrane component KefB